MQPHTPTKSIAIQSFTRSGNSFTRDSEVDRSFLDFSDEYKLQLSIPDVAALEQSPQRRRQLAEEGLEDQEVTIYHRYRIHFRRGVLNSFREHYHSQAQTLCQQWISKPRGEWNVTPRIATRPEATNSAERDELRQLLYQVLAKHQPPASENSSYTSKVLRNGREIPAFSAPYSKNSGRTPRPPAIKRGSDDFSDVGPKRPKNITAGSSVANPSFGSSEPGGKYDHSFHRLSTNVSYGSTVFSDHDHSVSQGTQDTVEASSQEKLRWPPQQPRSAQHELFVSSGSLRGVNESLNNIGGRKEMHDTPQRNLDSSSPTRKCSNSDDLLSDHELYGIEPNRITSRALQDLQDRLDSSWRRFLVSFFCNILTF